MKLHKTWACIAVIHPVHYLMELYVIYAKTSPGADRQLHFFTKHGKTTGQRISWPCEGRYDIHLLSLIITGTEYLAVSCAECQKIHLINLHDEDQGTIIHIKIEILVPCVLERQGHYTLWVDTLV